VSMTNPRQCMPLGLPGKGLKTASSPRKRSRFFSPFKIRTEAEAYLPGCVGKVIAVPTSPGVAARSK
jgi:hypothetical protein